jgi:hypothetical protein
MPSPASDPINPNAAASAVPAAPVEAAAVPVAPEVAAAGAAPNPIVSLPTWTDSQAVTTYVVSVVGAVFGLLGTLHPGWTEPSWVTAVIPSVGILVAFAAQWVNVATHRGTNKAVALAVINNTLPSATPLVAITNPVRLTSQQKKVLKEARQVQVLHAAHVPAE